MSVESIFANAASRIAGAISRAARSTGTSFDYLLTTAQMESGLNPKAQAPTSTAQGLYQFIDQTWLATLKREGPALGLGKYADAIQQDADGHYSVPDPSARAAILKLRSDPSASALMAGAFARANATDLASAIGRQPTESELYMAHFLGSAGAVKLIQAAKASPQAKAADLFPQAAAANRAIFYGRDGQARRALGVYDTLTKRYEAARAIVFDPALRGSIDGATGQVATAAPDTASIARTYAEASEKMPAAGPPPAFQSMFSDLPRHGVSPTVNALWGTGDTAAPAGGRTSQLLDLFRTGATDVRKLFGDGV
jgi:Transglycosylase SLT domain